MKIFFILGALFCALAVALGAFGSHGLEGKLSAKMIEVYKTGVQYHMYHALGILAVGFLAMKIGTPSSLVWSGWLMVIGIILFSGSLYILSTTGITKLGMITPLGGVAFIVGWVLFIVAAVKHM
ncbi:membrane protein [Fictibacillus macauensis ZFHKF-1]|uniref:Membrane protein n=1 Tax=Fictibacillus macauensis ZFHKF-1 TaxID=1196324 RepID=I8AEE5_9BACL|nr:DUF423 domain-containing protein [Fictibacillus macauensis]EIT83694.1 membrane protein [Fictibacillus macauensis ZFHKF-1]